MLAAIQAIPSDIYEAAAIDGATGRNQFLYITVPLMRRTIAFFLVISTLGVLQMFAEPYVLTGGGPYNATTTAGFGDVTAAWQQIDDSTPSLRRERPGSRPK